MARRATGTRRDVEVVVETAGTLFCEECASRLRRASRVDRTVPETAGASSRRDVEAVLRLVDQVQVGQAVVRAVRRAQLLQREALGRHASASARALAAVRAQTDGVLVQQAWLDAEVEQADELCRGLPGAGRSRLATAQHDTASRRATATAVDAEEGGQEPQPSRGRRRGGLRRRRAQHGAAAAAAAEAAAAAAAEAAEAAADPWRRGKLLQHKLAAVECALAEAEAELVWACLPILCTRPHPTVNLA
jgi:hypothetical protein